MIVLLTTGLSETRGADIERNVREFRHRFPKFDDVAVVPVNTPDYSGCVESGFAATVTEVIRRLLPAAGAADTLPGRRRRQVNVVAGSLLTPGDLEVISDLVERFGLRPMLVPDLSESLDGHLTDAEFSPVSVDGTACYELATLGDAAGTLVIGASMNKVGRLLEERTGVPTRYFDHLHGLHATDAFIVALSQISGRDVPERIERRRAQLLDAMRPHFMLGQLRIAIAAGADLLNAMVEFTREVGADVVSAVAPANAAVLEKVALDSVQIGDLEDLEKMAAARHAQLLIGNSHATATAERLGVPILRCGFPLYDQIGGYQKSWVGYQGGRKALFDLANLAFSRSHNEDSHMPFHLCAKAGWRSAGLSGGGG